MERFSIQQAAKINKDGVCLFRGIDITLKRSLEKIEEVLRENGDGAVVCVK